jgi:exopolysaccharide biosynthesis polyprenyl glycosylphosphotransferase
MSSFLPNAPRTRVWLVVADTLALWLAVWLAHLVRFSSYARPAKWSELTASPGLIVTATVAMLAMAVAAELYEPMSLRRKVELATRIAVAMVAWAAVLGLATYLVPPWQFGRGLLALTAALWGLLALASRWMVRQWLRTRPRPQVLVVGEPAAVADIVGRLQQHPISPWDAVDGAAIPAADVAREVAARGAELVVVAGGGAAASGLALDLAAMHFSGVPVVVASEMWAWLDARLPVAELSPEVFLHQPGFGAVHWQLFNRFTRVLDVGLSALILIVSSPVMLLAAIGTLLTDGAPVLYRQTRVGQFGRRFRIIKLRTMVRNAETNGPVFAEPNDPRCTAVGRILRRLRVDELPQLWNVLRGEMSLVGPRPERPEFVRQLAGQILYYAFRLSVPPGITGWAQVNMAYATTVEEHQRRLEYDLYFIRERSVGLYLLTLLRTLSVALVGAGR